MKLRFLASAALVIVLLGACGREAAIGPQSPDLVDRAHAIVDDLVHARWEGARHHFDDRLKFALTSDRLAIAWTGFERLRGVFVSQGDAKVLRFGQYRLAVVVVHMAKGDGVVQISFDRSGKVAGLFLRQPGGV